MLRPATPLSILLFIAFVLLLLATISTPIIKAIPIATVNGVQLGVFGYCEPEPKGCIGPQVGYSVDPKILFGDAGDDSEFSLPMSARSSLSSIMIVHPVAALLTLICFLMSIAAHFHSPSHSPRYLIFILIASIPTLLVTLLAFLVDILLFVPHVAWGGWIVLASTILILASGIVTCAMRRTLVSRKERKRRIDENADMNGQNFYATQNPVPQGIVSQDLRADSPPPLSSGPIGQSDKLPSYAAFEKKAREDDQIPLNTRTPSNKTVNSAPGSRGHGQAEHRPERYGAPPRGAPMGMRGGRGGFGGPKDEYGNPLPPSNAFGPVQPMGVRRDRSEPPMRRQYSDESMTSYGSRGGRGRGGYPPRGYGSRGRPYGPGPGRGGFTRGPVGPPPNRGPPPPGYGNGYPPPGRPDQFEGPGPAGYGRSPSAPGYGRRNYSPGPPSNPGGYGRQSPGPPSAPGGYNDSYNRAPSRGQASDPGGYNRAPSRGQASDPGGYSYDRQQTYNEPPPQPYKRQSPPQAPLPPPSDLGMIGQAVEMDARHGSPGVNPNQLRDSDSDVRGFVGLQQQQAHRESPMSMTSVYSANETYVPPRAAWRDKPSRTSPEPPANFIHMDSATTSSIQDAIELPEQNTIRKTRSPTGPSKLNPASHGRKQSSDDYYEDVDPRFAEPSPPHITTQTPQPSGPMPTALVPGQRHIQEQQGEIVDPTSSYEDLEDGQRSPASDHSNMTSISQRGVNPNWHPGEPQQQGGRLGVPGGRKPVPSQPQRDAYLQSTPAFPQHPGPSRGGPSPPIVVPPITQHGQAF